MVIVVDCSMVIVMDCSMVIVVDCSMVIVMDCSVIVMDLYLRKLSYCFQLASNHNYILYARASNTF